MKRPFKRILYGGDYNPNQWGKEVWKEDMRIFKDARINSATINVFSWAKIQPSEDTYNFTELLCSARRITISCLLHQQQRCRHGW